MSEQYRMYHIAKLYHIDGLKQAEIAERLAISSMSVSRMLKRAEEEGIVTVQVRPPMRMNLELGSKLRRRFPGLQEAVVVCEEDPAKERQRIGEAAAQYVGDILRPDATIGLSWGRAIREFTDRLQQINLPGIKVVQLSGGFLFESDFLTAPSNLVKLASDRLGCGALFLSTPMYVKTPEVKAELMADRMNRYVMEQARHSFINVVGLSELAQDTTISKVGIVSARDHRELLAAGAIGDVVGFFVDESGDEVAWSKRDLYVGIGLNEIAAAPHVVCLASGRNKARVAAVAIRRGYINTLVTSDALASALLEA